jgi:hypothetical protein
MIEFEPAIKDTATDTIQSAIEFENGPKHDPIQIVAAYNADQWEEFTHEWVHSLEGSYVDTERATGAGDKGIDIAGFCDEDRLAGTWDNYQCKCYQRRPLSFGDIAPEIGKILRYSFSGIYTPPRVCYYIAPKGASTALSLLVNHAPNLKAKVLEEWDKKISTKITDTQKIELSDDFLQYVENFNFGIFRVPSTRWILDQYRSKTNFFNRRFGGGLPPMPKPKKPPEEITEEEKTYVDCLLEAYAQHQGVESLCVSDLPKWKKLNDHLKRSREAFFDAEGLRVFVRDKTERGTFESLQDQIHDGVVDTKDKPHKDGYECVVAVTEQAHRLALDAHPLNKVALPTVRKGVCHQLANDGRLEWKQ